MDGLNVQHELVVTSKTTIANTRQKSKVSYENMTSTTTAVTPVSLPNNCYALYNLATVTLDDTLGAYNTYLWHPMAQKIVFFTTTFAFVRPVLRVVLDISTNPGVTGFLNAQWVPSEQSVVNRQNANHDPFLIDLNEGGIYEFIIPYVYYKNQIRLSDIVSTTGPYLYLTWDVDKLDSTTLFPMLKVLASFVSIEPRGISQMETTAGVAATVMAGIGAFNGAGKIIEETTKTVAKTKEVANGFSAAISDAWITLGEFFDDVGETVQKEGSIPSNEPIVNNPLGSFGNVNTGSYENFNTVNYRLTPAFKGDLHPKHSIRDMIRKSEIMFVLGKNTFTTQNELVTFTIPVTPVANKLNTVGAAHTNGYNTHLNYAAQLFAYWRGSMCYKFMFFTSPYISYRVVVSLSNRQTPYPTLNGNFYRKEEVFSGSGQFDFIVPFLSDNDWISTGATTMVGAPRVIISGATTTGVVPGYCGLLTCTITFLNCAQGDRAKPIHTVVTGKGGEDMQFRRPYPFRKGTSQMRIANQMYESEIVEGSNYYSRYPVEEDDMCLEDFARKWSGKTVESLAMPYQFLWQTGEFTIPNYYDISMYSYVSMLFQYIRGGVEFKFIYPEQNVSGSQFYISFLDNSVDLSTTASFVSVTNGAIGRIKGLNPILDGEFHFECEQEWLRTFFTNYPNPQRPCLLFLDPIPLGQVTIYARCTKDTQFAYMLAPPIDMYMPWYLGAGA